MAQRTPQPLRVAPPTRWLCLRGGAVPLRRVAQPTSRAPLRWREGASADATRRRAADWLAARAALRQRGAEGARGAGVPAGVAAAALRRAQQALTWRALRRQGRKVICLCISEPYAGSDVAALRTTAVKDGSGHYIVNGEKKWCDY